MENTFVSLYVVLSLIGCDDTVSVALLPSQKYTRENIATRLIHHLLSQNGEKSRDMFVSDAILNQSLLGVRCVFVECSAQVEL